MKSTIAKVWLSVLKLFSSFRDIINEWCIYPSNLKLHHISLRLPNNKSSGYCKTKLKWTKKCGAPIVVLEI